MVNFILFRKNFYGRGGMKIRVTNSKCIDFCIMNNGEPLDS